MLYFADMFSFVQEGRPITGEEYLKQKFGPTARQLGAVIRQLEEQGVLKIEEQVYFGFKKKTYLILKSYEPARLSESDQSLLREVADFVRGHSARSISDVSHDSVWQAAAMGELLPYYTALQLSAEEATEDDMTWAFEAARTHAAARHQ